MLETFRQFNDPLDDWPLQESPVAVWGTVERVRSGCRIHAFIAHESGGVVALCGTTRSSSVMPPRRGLHLCEACDYREAELRRRLKPALPVITLTPTKFEPGAIRRRSLQRQGAK
jgi:hypothetical protein